MTSIQGPLGAGRVGSVPPPERFGLLRGAGSRPSEENQVRMSNVKKRVIRQRLQYSPVADNAGQICSCIENRNPISHAPPPAPEASRRSVGLGTGWNTTHRKDSRMKRLIVLGFGLVLAAVMTGCCCTPCCSSPCGFGGGGCGPGGCGVPATSMYAPSGCSTCGAY